MRIQCDAVLATQLASQASIEALKYVVKHRHLGLGIFDTTLCRSTTREVITTVLLLQASELLPGRACVMARTRLWLCVAAAKKMWLLERLLNALYTWRKSDAAGRFLLLLTTKRRAGQHFTAWNVAATSPLRSISNRCLLLDRS